MNFKVPETKKHNKLGFSLSLIVRNNSFIRIGIGKDIMDKIKVNNLAFSIEKNNVIIVVNPPKDVPQYTISNSKNLKGSNSYGILNKDLAENIANALNLSNEKTIKLNLIPTTKYFNYDTYKITV
jgi:hypothetical protein